MTKIIAITDGVKSFPVGKLGHGLMHLTWVVPTITPDERAFEAIKLALDSGINYLDSGEFYGNGQPTLNLELVSRFFTKYPEYASKAFLSVKGAVNLTNFQPDGSEEGIRRSVDNILKHLGGAKKMDLFQCARVDPKVPIEESMATLKKLVEEGKFDYIGLSEVKAETIRRAHKVHPVAAVEVEYSPWSMDIEHNKVLETCKELGIPIIAYSPLGRGMLSGKIRSLDDLEANDIRRHLERFTPENFHHNIKLADKLSEIASKKGCTPVQLCLAWEMKQWEKIIPIPGSTRPDGVRECIGSFDVVLSEEEDHEIRKAVKEADIKGGRYYSNREAFLEG